MNFDDKLINHEENCKKLQAWAAPPNLVVIEFSINSRFLSKITQNPLYFLKIALNFGIIHRVFEKILENIYLGDDTPMGPV